MARILQRDFLQLADLIGAKVMEQTYDGPTAPVTLMERKSSHTRDLIAAVRDEMVKMLWQKETAVKELKKAAEKAMKQYGPYKDQIDYEDVQYFNAKKVVIDDNFESMDREYEEKITGTIDYLPTDKQWHFGQNNLKLNTNTSTVHVPTNIYDKSNKILNGVQWTENLTDQFENNSFQYPTLRWQYFCSSDGFFRIFPGMQWPRDPEKVDVFDCRMQKWYIQAASKPKNIIILLDTSGSMTGKRFNIAQSTVSTILDTLSDEDYFNIIKFSKEPEYVDTCFNDTMMPANVDNIRRMQEKIMKISTKDTADLRKALLLAFRLFKEEEKMGGSICNKAIMIITDGAPENYVDVYNKSNWPEKATRIFTYLIGKEVADDRKVQWMACVNKGEFTHISTKADVQENVQQYIKVLSRPLAQNKTNHHVWSAVYLDYPSAQSDIVTDRHSYMNNHIDPSLEEMAAFKGLGLVISYAMPVFDHRTNKTVSKNEEPPEKNLLGVVGTDVRINDIVKIIPNYELGVNGYAFGVTHNGYILFHPDFRPFYNNAGKLELRPKYNSVDLSEVELPHNHAGSRRHDLRQYVLTVDQGGHNTTETVLTHFDGMKRVKLQKNRYQFVAVNETFRLVFVLPNNYGNRVVRIDETKAPSLKKSMQDMMMTRAQSETEVAPWIYCTEKSTGRRMQLKNPEVTIEFLNSSNPIYNCDRKHVMHLLFDMKATLQYDQVWSGRFFNADGRSKNKLLTECLYRVPKNESYSCIQKLYMQHGIEMAWVGTASGFTRFKRFTEYTHFDTRYRSAIDSLYYRRAVYGWDEGIDHVFYLDGLRDDLKVTMSKAELMGRNNPDKAAPVAVVGFRMLLSHFSDIFFRATTRCPGNMDCNVTCNDTDILNCYLIDNNGYILVTNNNDTGVGEFLGKYDPTMMKELVRHGYFYELNVTDYQAMCTSHVTSQDSSSSFITTPFRLLFQVLFWFFAEIGLFIAEWSIRSWFYLQSVASQNVGDSPEDKCGENMPQRVSYYLCNFVIYESKNEMYNTPYTVNDHACVMTASRYTLNTTRVRSKTRFSGSLTDCSRCNSTETVSYTVHWIEQTNLLMIMAAANCQCQTPNDTFLTTPYEMQYTEDQQCERLFKFSTELKRVDNTRALNTECLDSRNEEDYTCGQSALRPPCNLLTYFVLLPLLACLVSTRLSLR